jgi:23S rRNA (cytosine1962-C5)-methyltransferase
MTLPAIRLMAGRERRLRAGHPWAYSNEVAMTAEAKALPPGELVRLLDADGRPIGRAFFNPRSLIAARLIDRGESDQPVDQAFLEERLAAALTLRDRLFDGPHYRLVHGESDRLPGLVLDRFGPVLVLQPHAAGIDRLLPDLIAAARRVLDPAAIILRADAGGRALEGLDERTEVVHGDLDGTIEVVENRVRFPIDPVAGQKTGWFFDQRDNRRAIAELAAGADVLDLFAYGGGFGVTCAVAGAAHATLVDRSRPALAQAEAAAALNRVTDRVETRPGDAFNVMQTLFDEKRRFDIVIADPPAFVKSRKDYATGVRAYRKTARLAAQLVAPGGFLFLASCSHNVTMDGFIDEMRAGLARAQRSGRVLRQSGAAADHPVHPFLPESGYLKAVLLQLD